MCNSHWSSTATVVTPKRLSVMLIHTLPLLLISVKRRKLLSSFPANEQIKLKSVNCAAINVLLRCLCQSHCCVLFLFSFDVCFNIVGDGARGRYKCDCERSHNVGFNGTVTSQTAPAKILATQLLERLEIRKTTEIGHDWHVLHFGNGTITPENTWLEGSDHISAKLCPKSRFPFFCRCALSRPAVPQLFIMIHKFGRCSLLFSSEASLFLFGKVAYTHTGQQSYNLTRFELLTAVNMHITVFCNVTPCILVKICWHFGATYSLYRQCRRKR